MVFLTKNKRSANLEHTLIVNKLDLFGISKLIAPAMIAFDFGLPTRQIQSVQPLSRAGVHSPCSSFISCNLFWLHKIPAAILKEELEKAEGYAGSCIVDCGRFSVGRRQKSKASRNKKYSWLNQCSSDSPGDPEFLMGNYCDSLQVIPFLEELMVTISYSTFLSDAYQCQSHDVMRIGYFPKL
ncbi:hypothetical protein M513_01485 [Trichuris suis]|uniref:Uncharacterized protein n=1 Tax=Trichuris suis TaxID=68888 RepID=A0A085MKR9_9BILA|nr:hypothetical protein M513_01485 [Trichuris suis]